MGTLARLQQFGQRVPCQLRRGRGLQLLLRQLWPRAGFRHWIIQQNNNSGQLRLNCPIKKLYIQVREILNVCKSKG